ncbi:zinc metalloprotease HtpX [Caenispirillum bisanense]|uniref:zinc metalloprotease HtpX n=1 Tax=Caenispirillum bisanense TaxID=414052 RepID=UPI0031D9C1EA
MAWMRALTHGDALLSLAGMIAVLALTGWLIAGPDGLLVTLAVAVATVAMAATVPPAVAMRLIGARPVHPQQAPGLYTLLVELSDAAGLAAPPVLYRLPGGSVTALSVGDCRRAAIALSDGMTMVMDRRELRGVLAHEVAHVAAADTALMTLAAVLGRVVHTLAFFGVMAAILVVLFTAAPVPPWLVLAIAAAPWAATLLHLSLSRRREFAADAEAARLTGDPQGLALALVKLETLPRGGLARLLRPAGRSAGGWLRTHPPTRARIERLVGPIADRVRPLYP